jgi:hypothetical protein
LSTIRVGIKELNELIEEGLTLIGAEKHLELFQQQSKSKINEQCKLNKFLKRKIGRRKPY